MPRLDHATDFPLRALGPCHLRTVISRVCRSGAEPVQMVWRDPLHAGRAVFPYRSDQASGCGSGCTSAKLARYTAA